MSKILLLEDDAGLLYTLRTALEGAGHKVLSATSVADAICTLRDEQPDVLVLDLIINSSYSIQVADYAGIALPDAQVIYITGSGMFPQGELFGLSGNARWVLRKPLKLKDLIDMVDHFSGDQQSVEQAQPPMVSQ